MKIIVNIMWDEEVQRFVATSKSLRGLVCEAERLEQVECDIAFAVDMLLPLQFATGFTPPYITELRFS